VSLRRGSAPPVFSRHQRWLMSANCEVFEARGTNT
jgi:hypothetical protein